MTTVVGGNHGSFPLPRAAARGCPRQIAGQWVLSLPFALRYLLATRPEVVTQVLGIVCLDDVPAPRVGRSCAKLFVVSRAAEEPICRQQEES